MIHRCITSEIFSLRIFCSYFQKSWDIALGPFKQIPMNLFIMYMAGNSISIFPIMMVGMMFLRPVKALLAIKSSEWPMNARLEALSGEIPAWDMASKQWQNRRNGHKWHKDWLKVWQRQRKAQILTIVNTDSEMAFSSIHKMTGFEIQTRDIHTSPTSKTRKKTLLQPFKKPSLTILSLVWPRWLDIGLYPFLIY